MGMQGLKYKRFERVNSLRLAWNMTESDLGDVLGISASAVSRRITGHMDFSDAEIEKLADWGHIDKGWFDNEDA